MVEQYIERTAPAGRTRRPEDVAQVAGDLRQPDHRYRAPADITTADVLAILEPHWTRVPETMSRVRGRIEAVSTLPRRKGLRDGENVARWKGHLALMLPAKGKVKRIKHHEAVPLDKLPATFRKLLAKRASLAAQAAAFCILTAARPGEAAEASWPEIDLKSATWVLPAERMKNGREHRVALSPPAVALLQRMAKLRRRDDDRVFPSRGSSTSTTTMIDELRSAAGGTGKPTVHGTARSCFDDFGHQHTQFPSWRSTMRCRTIRKARRSRLSPGRSAGRAQAADGGVGEVPLWPLSVGAGNPS